MTESIYIEIEENENCEEMPMQVYEVLDNPKPINMVKLIVGGQAESIYEITGWTSENDGSPCTAMFMPISDSGQAVAYLIKGGEWGVRLKPAGTQEKWDLNSSNQWGEPYLILTDKNDLTVSKTASVDKK